MDRDPDALDGAPRFTFRRLWVTLLLSAAVIAAGSFLVRAFPNSGREAGYEAAITKGPQWARAEVDAANGSALPACNRLHSESEATPGTPRYEYDSFVKGCGEAVDRLLGGHIPLLPDDR